MENQHLSVGSPTQDALSASVSNKSILQTMDSKIHQKQVDVRKVDREMCCSKLIPEITEVSTAKGLSHSNVNVSQSENPESMHKFWGSQPILLNSNYELSDLNSPIVQDSTVIREQPFTLSSSFEWSELDLTLDCEIQELYDLLCENYVEDDDHMFRFAYSKEFLIWALKPPGWLSEYHCGIRVKTSHKLVAFISAVPAEIFVKGKLKQMVEINFLCVHEKLRNKRVAPVLIREITRRVNLNGIFQAVFTSGAKLPNLPVAVCRYWHRSLNPKKLIEVEFSYLTRNMTLQRALKLYKLPEKTITPGLRKLKFSDSKAVCDGLNLYLSRFELYPKFTEKDIIHWFTPHEGIIYSWVVQPAPSEPITDMISFYSIPSSVIRHPKHKHLYTAYLFYYFTSRTPFSNLLYDAVILAKSNNFDVFNALDIMENKSVLEDLKFGMGDGNLQYFFYNWCCDNIATDNVGLVLQ